MRVLALLTALLFALAGCTGADEPDSNIHTQPDDAAPEEPEPEPKEPVRLVIDEVDLSLNYGYQPDGPVGCEAIPVGALGGMAGPDPLRGQDYDYFLVDDEHLEFNFTFTNTGSSLAAFIWVDDQNNGIDWQRVAAGETWEKEIPDDAYLGALGGCEPARPASATVEIHDMVFE